MRKVAVTGGLASGKTTVCQILKSCGAFVVSADEIVHQLLSPNTLIGKQVACELGSDIINETENQFDRTKIAEIVFSDPKKLQALEKLIHPAVLQEIEKCYQKIKKQKIYRLFVAEIPLLYESESEKFFDIVIAVVADPELCSQRFQKCTGNSAEQYDLRMKRQWSQEKKSAKANYTIVNNGDLKELNKKVLQLFPMLL